MFTSSDATDSSSVRLLYSDTYWKPYASSSAYADVQMLAACRT